MNADKLKKLAEEAAEAGWDYPGFVMKEGRYYDRMCFIELGPEMGLSYGGNLNALIWRFTDKPDEWILTFRTRYNSGPNTSPWLTADEGGDRKRWSAARANGEKGRRSFINFLEELPLKASGHFKTDPLFIDWLVIQGDDRKFIEMVRREKKPWMHIRVEKIENEKA